MFETLRKVFGPAIVVFIVGAISLVFVFTGITPGDGGGGGVGVAATVNGENILFSRYEREYQRRVEFYQNMFKEKADAALLERLGLRRQVIEDLINQKLMIQSAEKMGVRVADEAVREEIQAMPYFKKDKEGTFDPELYKRILEANRRSPADFEEDVRQDLTRTKLMNFIRGMAKVSRQEVENEFLLSENRRQIDYVLIDRQSARKRLAIPQSEITAFLKKDSNVKSAEAYYQANKYRYVKPKKNKQKMGKLSLTEKQSPPEYKTFKEVKNQVVTELLKDRKTDQILKINKDLSADLLKKAKTMSDKAFKAYVKRKGLEVKTSSKFNKEEPPVPTLGGTPALVKDVFSKDTTLAKTPKLYEFGPSFVIAKNLKVFAPDLKRLEKDRAKIQNDILQKKQEAVYREWLTKLREESKITVSKYVEGDK